MTAMPKEATKTIEDLERDVRDEEEVLRDLERDLHRDAEVLKHLERDVAELERLLPGVAVPAHRPRRAGAIALAVGTGVVLMAAAFAIAWAVQGQTIDDLQAEVDQAVLAEQAATQQLQEAEAFLRYTPAYGLYAGGAQEAQAAMLDYATFAVPFETAAAAATVDASVRHEAMGQIKAGVAAPGPFGQPRRHPIPVETQQAEAAADLAQRVEHATTAS